MVIYYMAANLRSVKGENNPNYRGGEYRSCVICGKQFWNYPSRDQKTCSVECGHILQGRSISGENNPNYKDNLPTLVCNYCGKEFRLQSFANLRRAGRGQFCSKECHNKSMMNGKWRKCEYCGRPVYASASKTLNGEGRFCSRECWIRSNKRSSYKIGIICGILDELSYKYVLEKTFDWLKNPKTNANLYLDIYIDDIKVAIEYDGKQHFQPTMPHQTQDDVTAIQERDMIKEQLCEEHGIKLVRFSYKDNLSWDLLVQKLSLVV